jgi:hypothetical protein
MARVLDDIVHCFTQRGIDILASPAVMLHCLDHQGAVLDALSHRAYPDSDLIRELVEGEQHVRILEDQVRSLWSDRRRLTQQLEAALHTKQEN